MSRIVHIAVSLGLVAVVCLGQSRVSPEQRQAALALEQEGKLVEAEAAWQAVLKAQPNSPEACAHIGLLAARQQHYPEAIAFYRKALTLNSNLPGVRLNLALALFKTGELKEAVPEFQKVRRAVPTNSPEAKRCTILLGMSYYGLADYAHAAPYLKEAAAYEPASLPLLMALAHSYLWSSQFTKVLDVYRQILALDPDSAEADMLAGEALDQMKNSTGAIQMFRNAVKANPRELNVHFGLGYLLWTQKQYSEAEHEFQAELANDPDHIQAMLYLADTYMQVNQTEDAVRLLEKVIALDPSLALAHLDLGIIHMNAGRTEDAVRELELAEKLKPDEVNVHWRLGRLYRSQGRADEAKAELDKANTLTRQADEALFKKMADRAAHPPKDLELPAEKESR